MNLTRELKLWLGGFLTGVGAVHLLVALTLLAKGIAPYFTGSIALVTLVLGVFITNEGLKR